MTEQHQAAFLEFDHDHDGKFSRSEVSELLSCMDKVGLFVLIGLGFRVWV